MDYKELLRKYMYYVEECEGINFLGHFLRIPPFVDTIFTEKEMEELLNLIETS